MNFIAWLSLFSCLFCAGLGVLVYSFNRKRMLNKLFLATTLAGAYYGITAFLMWESSSIETAYFWNKMGFTWAIFSAFVLHFSLLYTESKWLKSKLTYMLIYGPAVAFTITDLTTDLISGLPTQVFWGWKNTTPNPPFVLYVDYFWVVLLTLMSLTTCISYTLKVKDCQKKRQSEFVTLGFAIPIIVFITTNIIFPVAKIDLPNLGHIANLAFGLSVGYAIYKYDLFTFDATMASDSTISTMPDSLVLIDLKGKIVSVNKKFEEFSGYSEKEVVGMHASEFGSDSDQFQVVAKQLLDKRSITGLEIKITTKEGKIKDASISASTVRIRNSDVGFTCIIHDITHLKETEKEVEKNKNYLETIMNSMLSGIIVIDGLTHRVIDANDTALKMIGVSRETLFGTVCHQFICPAEIGKCPITDLGLTVENRERVLLDSNGNKTPVLKSVTKIMADDRPILIENFVDISERKKMEGLLLKSERLASIGELAGQIGHDLRNPLTGIKGGVYLLKKKNDLDQESKFKIIKLIEDAIEDSNRIINSLLEYSADMRLDCSSYSIDSILSSTFKKIAIPDRIKIVKNIEVDDLTVDFGRMEIVFLNLLKNAIEAIPNEGTIEITTRQNNSEIEISFTDSGTGIPSNILSEVFTPLITTKAKGMGLGLPICKRIIDAHEGKIVIDESSAEGTIVTIKLPVKPKIEFIVDNHWITANQSVINKK